MKSETMARDVVSRAEFGAALTALRRESGLSLRDVAGRIDSSASTLGDWCRGDRLPFPANEQTFAAMLAAFGVADPIPWIEALHRVRDGGQVDRQAHLSPYPGLASFGPDDQEWFHGREQLAGQVVEMLQHGVADPGLPAGVVLVGASGSGKSSVLNAGVVPRLVQDWECVVVSCTPGRDPLVSLATAVAETCGLDGHQVLARLRSGADLPTTLGLAQASDSVSNAGQSAASLPDVVVVVDQLEEGLAHAVPSDTMAEFLDLITTDLSCGEPRIALIVALRIDFYSAATLHPAFSNLLERQQILVGSMSTGQLAEAIETPARSLGVAVDDDLLDVLLRDFVPIGSGGRHDVGSLPLLAHALRQTWSLSSRGVMTLADYRRTGGVAGAVGETAESVHESLDRDQQRLARRLFLRLVSVDPAGPSTRRTLLHAELEAMDCQAEGSGGNNSLDASASNDQPGVAAVVQRFVDARLLTSGREGIQIAHEALLDAWPRLRTWVSQAEDDLDTHHSLSDAARLWQETGRDEANLLAGTRLEAAQGLADRSNVTLNRLEREFLSVSGTHARRSRELERHRVRRLRRFVVALASLLLVAGVLAVMAMTARRDAVLARDEAMSRQVAVTAQRVLDSNPTLAAQMSLAGHAIADTLEARSGLLDAAVLPMATRFVGDAGQTSMASDGADVLALGNSADASVQLFARTRTEWSRAGVIHLEEGSEIYSMVVVPASHTLVVGLFDSSIQLWDISEPATPVNLHVVLQGPELAIQDLELAPSGQEIAASGLGDGVFRWDLSNPDEPRALPLVASAGVSWDASYGPDGTWMAVAREDGRVEVWTLGQTPERTAVATLGEVDVFSVDASPDGRQVAAGTRTGQLHLLTLSADLEELSVADPWPESEFESWVNAIDFSDDGGLLVAGTSALEARVWDTADGRVVERLSAPAPVVEVDVLADDTVLTAANDGALYLWPPTTASPTTVPGRVFDIAFADDGETMAAFSGAQTTVWNTAGNEPRKVAQVRQLPDGLEFDATGDLSADGRWLAHGTMTGQVVLEDLQGERDSIVVGEEGGLVEAVKFSPDGYWLVATQRAPDNPQTWVWPVERLLADEAAAEPVVLADAEQVVLQAGWSPDAGMLALGSADDATYLYEVADGSFDLASTLVAPTPDDVFALDFNADGTILATGQPNSLVMLWDVADPAAVEPLAAPYESRGRRIYDLAFHPDRDVIATAGTEGSLGVLDVSDPVNPVREAMLTAGDDSLYVATFHPDGRRVVGSGADGWIRMWPLDPGTAADRICGGRGDPMTEEEWDSRVPGRSWVDPCASD